MKTALLILLLLFSPGLAAAKGFSGGSSFSAPKSYSAPTRSYSAPSTRSTAPSTRSTAPSTRSTAPSVRTTAPTSTSLFGGTAKTSSTYKPTFRGGYAPPAGSTVIYQSDPWYHYLPLWYLLTHDSHRDVTVKQPDGKQVKTQEQGIDTMYIINWIITILLALGLIGGIIWYVNKLTTRRTANAAI